MIREVTVTGYKALAHVTVTLEQLTVIVGANATGKSSLLDAIDFLASATGRPRAIQGFLYTVAEQGHGTHGSSRPFGILAVTDESRVELVAGKTGGWTHTMHPFDGPLQDLTAQAEGQPPPSAALTRAMRLRLDGAELAKPSDLTVGYDGLRPSGEGLAAVLQRLQLAKDGSFDAIEAALRTVVPSAVGLRTMPQNGGGKSFAVVEVRTPGRAGNWSRASTLSEGTLVTLAILTALHDAARPELLLLDDIDRGLHPRAQAHLVECIRSILLQEPKPQIICTTHSPHMVNCFAPEEVRLFALDAAGHTVASRLVDHPDWPQWRDTFASGEFWASVGDEWVAEARA